jgi:hypothetical protein
VAAWWQSSTCSMDHAEIDHIQHELETAANTLFPGWMRRVELLQHCISWSAGFWPGSGTGTRSLAVVRACRPYLRRHIAVSAHHSRA